MGEQRRNQGSLIATVSHELRSPLAGIREAVAQVLEGLHGPVTKHQESVLATTVREVDNLTRYINDLLDLARLRDHADSLRWEKVDLCSIAREASAIFVPELNRKGLALLERFPAAGVWAYADRDQVYRVFSNLLGNALKFTSEGHISIRVWDDDDRVAFAVEDTGIGISREDLPGLFKRFVQSSPRPDRNAGRGPGSGLGLAICAEIVQRHGGGIRVESAPARGATFFVHLPKKSLQGVFTETLEQAASDRGATEPCVSVVVFRLPSGLKETFSEGQLPPGGLGDFIASRLRRRGDMAFHDGERVLALLPATCKGNALVVAGRIRQAVVEQFPLPSAQGAEPELESVVWNLPEDAADTKQLLSLVFGVVPLPRP